MTPPFQRLLAQCLEWRLTFAAFRVPGAPVELWVQQQPDVEGVPWEQLDRTTDRFLVMPFAGKPRGPFAVRPDVRITDMPNSDVEHVLANCKGNAGQPQRKPYVPRDAAEIFTSNVERAKAAISDGRMVKVVLSRSLQVRENDARLPELFTHALGQATDALVAMVSLPEHGTWLGASPERLMVTSDGCAHVDSLAGTMPVGNTPTEADAWGQKEREEQAMVTSSVVEAFRTTGFVEVQANGPRVVAAGPVAHLLTRVTAPVGARSVSALVRALHPTPAVCGTPRAEAMSFIVENEPVPRGLYAGFWGPWRSPNDARLFVNIRCLQHAEGTATIHAGAGITAGSDPEAELRETEEKARTWLAPIAALK